MAIQQDLEPSWTNVDVLGADYVEHIGLAVVFQYT